MNTKTSVLILGDAYFSVSKEKLTQAISELYNEGYHSFYVTNGSDFDRLAMEILYEIILNSRFEYPKLRLIIEPRSEIEDCLKMCGKILTTIEPKQLVKEDVELQDHPILYVYNSSLRTQIVNLFEKLVF